MQTNQAKLFVHLNLLHLLISLSFITLTIYLLTRSLLSKLNDCSGFYTDCCYANSIHLGSTSTEPPGERGSLQLGSEEGIISASSSSSSISTSPPQQRKQLATSTSWRSKSRAYDWIGLSQLAIVVSLLAIAIFGSLAIWLRNRRRIFIALLLHLVHLLQLALVEASDDRDFPRTIFPDGRSVARHSILYIASNSQTVLILKLLFLLTTLGQLLMLAIFFVLLRYEPIFRYYHHRERSSKRPAG